MSTSELATSYAALVLADDDVEVTVSKFLFKCRKTMLSLRSLTSS